MDYSQTLEYLFSSLRSFQDCGGDAYKPGLERIGLFLDLLGSPHLSYPTVHVAGTNGKGSVSHILAAVLRTAGYRVGLFTSPHLHDFRERIRIDGVPVAESTVVDFVERHRADMERIGLSFFEMTAAMAFDAFRSAEADVAVIETGLGGRLDATNVVSPLSGVITNIGLEHTEFLGPTIAAVAGEKAGIIKRGVPVVIGEHDPESDPVFRAVAAERQSPIRFAEDEFTVVSDSNDLSGSRFVIERRDGATLDLSLDLGGDYQRRNIVTALAALDVLRTRLPRIDDRAVSEGCRRAAAITGLQGRWQKLGERPLVICDTGHNAHGLRYVAEQLSRLDCRTLYIVLGVVREKDLSAVLPLLPGAARYVFTQASVARALDAEELCRRAAEYGLNGVVVRGVAAALEYARSLASPDDAIFVGGSTFTVAEIL